MNVLYTVNMPNKSFLLFFIEFVSEIHENKMVASIWVVVMQFQIQVFFSFKMYFWCIVIVCHPLIVFRKKKY